MGAALQSLAGMIRLIVTAAWAAFLAAPLASEPVQLHAGHLIAPGSGRVSHDRMLTLRDGGIVDDQPWQGAKRVGSFIDWSKQWVRPGLIDLPTPIAHGY